MASGLVLGPGDPTGLALQSAIRSGDLPALGRLLGEHAGLADARLADRKGASRAPLHVATDWPGHFPNGAAVVAALVAAGADPNARVGGASHAETPLHWAASSDDAEVADALIAAGADLEATGASIAGGTPLDDAVGYGCWQVARLLADRGARVDKLWHAAALGLTERVAAWFAGPVHPTAEEVNQAFWQACHGGQPRTAAYLLERGADPTYVPPYSKSKALEVAAVADGRREGLVAWLRGLAAAAS